MMMAFDSSRTPPSRLDDATIVSVRNALRGYLANANHAAPLREALLLMATDARANSMLPEQLLVVLKDEGQNLHHLAVAARRLEHALLQSPEGGRHLGEGRAVAQRARLALDDGEIMPPVIDRRAAHRLVGSSEDTGMLADDLPLGGDDDALGINPHADGPVSEGRWHAVPVAIQMDQTRRRDALGVFDEAVKGPRKLHQMWRFLAPSVSDCARLRGVRDLGP